MLAQVRGILKTWKSAGAWAAVCGAVDVHYHLRDAAREKLLGNRVAVCDGDHDRNSGASVAPITWRG